MAHTPTVAQNAIYDFVEHGQGNGIIDAVAGAGKTTTLMECVDHIPNPKDVLYCAFNTSIRKEIQKKFQQRGKSIAVKTIHSLGFQILRTAFKRKVELTDNKYRLIIENHDFFESLVPTINSILDANHFLSIQEIRQLQVRPDSLTWDDKNALNESAHFVNVIIAQICNINDKYRLTLSDDSFDSYRALVDHFNLLSDGDDSDTTLKLYMVAHQKLLKEGNSIAISHNIIDFTDQLYLPTVLQLESKVRYGFVFVDECQDLSRAQLSIVKKYVSPGGRVLAVGDPYQSIYGFAGADSESFQRVADTFKCKSLQLTDCFRCPSSVISVAQTIRTDIRGFKTEPGLVKKLENRHVADTVRSGDLVICRFRAPLLSLAIKLVNKDKKVHMHPDEVQEFIGDYKKYFRASELKKILSDEILDSFFSGVRSRNEKRIDKENDNVDPIIKSLKVKEEIKIMEESLDFFRKKYKEWQLDTIGSILVKLKEVLSYLGDDAIKISTIHRAKGLENNRVFILEYNKLPLRRDKEWENIQERNLHYVAVTRPMNELFLCMEKIEEGEMDEKPTMSSATPISDSTPFDIENDPPFALDDKLPALNQGAIPKNVGYIKILGITRISNIPSKFYSMSAAEDTPFPQLNAKTFQKAKYWAIVDALQDTEYCVGDVVSSNYNDAYFVESPNGTRIYDGHYKASGTYSFIPRGPYDDNDTLIQYLNNELNYPICYEYHPQNDGFEAVHSIIQAVCCDEQILITNIYKENGYNLIYCFKTLSSYAYIKLAFNGKGVISTLMPFSTIGEEDEKLNKILEMVSHLWQR